MNVYVDERKVASKLNSFAQEAKMKLSLTEGGKEGKKQLIATTRVTVQKCFGL